MTDTLTADAEIDAEIRARRARTGLYYELGDTGDCLYYCPDSAFTVDGITYDIIDATYGGTVHTQPMIELIDQSGDGGARARMDFRDPERNARHADTWVHQGGLP